MPTRLKTLLPNLSPPHQSYLLSLFVMVIVVTLLWAPFGLKRTIGLFEEWVTLTAPTRPDRFVYNIEPTRPLAFAPFILAQTLTPGSFVGFNLLMMLIFAGKGMMVYKILRHLLPQHQFLPFLAAILYIIYPADTGLMTFRAMNIHLAIMLGLMEVELLLREWEHPRRWHWVLICALQAVSLLTYEVIFVIIFASPGLLLWMQKRLSWRVVRVAALWLMVPTVLAVRMAYYIERGQARYVSSQINAQTEAGLNSEVVTQSLTTMYRRHVVAWFEVFNQVSLSAPYLIYALITGLAVGVMVWKHWSTDHPPQTRQQWVGPLLLGLSGLVLMALSFTPYILTAYRFGTFRVFYLSSLGAALALATLIYLASSLLRRWGKVPATAAAGFLVGLASLNALNQQAFFADASASVQRLLAGIVEIAPDVPRRNTVIVFIDERETFQDEWHLASSGGALKGALRFLYVDKNQDVYLCAIKTYRPVKACDFQPERLIYVDETGKNWVVRYSEILLFRENYNGEIELLDQMPEEYWEPTTPEALARALPSEAYNPHPLIDMTSPPPRVYSFFLCWPIDECLPPPQITPQSHVRLDFDQKVPGLGWERPFEHPTKLWTTEPKATVYFNLVPGHAYTVRFQIDLWLAEDIIGNLRLKVNDVEIPLMFSPDPDGGIVVEGLIPSEVIDADPTITKLLISTNRTVSPLELGISEDWRQLGLLFDWLEINPVDQA